MQVKRLKYCILTKFLHFCLSGEHGFPLPDANNQTKILFITKFLHIYKKIHAYNVVYLT